MTAYAHASWPIGSVTALVAAALVACALLPPAAHGAPGDLDPAFGSAGKLTLAVGPGSANINAAVAQSDGKLVVAGFAEQTAGDNRDFLVARLNPNGTLDTSFNATGPQRGVVTTAVGAGTADDTAFALALGPASTIYAVGTTDPPTEFADLAIVRYTSTGAVDSGFSTDGVQTHSTGSVEGATAAGVQPDGRLVIAGFHGSSEGGMLVARLDGVTGALDPTFNASGATPGVNEVVFTPGFGTDRANALALRDNGRIVVAGTANLSSADDDVALAQLNGNGTLDTLGFGAGTGMVRAGPAKDQGTALALAPDGKLVVAGSSFSGGPLDFLLARFKADGSPDASFSGDGIETTVFPAADGTRFATASGVAVQPDGKLLAGGSVFTCSAAGCADFAVARYNPDGSLDTSFGDAGKRTYGIGSANDFATAALQGSLFLFGYSFDGVRERIAAARISTDPSVIGAGGPPPPQPAVGSPPPPVLEVKKRALLDDPVPARITGVAQGQTVRYHVDVTNRGAADLEDVTVVDTLMGPARGLPGGAEAFPVVNGETVGQGQACSLLPRRKGFRCEIGRLGVGETRRIIFFARADGRASGEIENSADASGRLAGQTIRASSEVRLDVHTFTGTIRFDLTRAFPFIFGKAGIEPVSQSQASQRRAGPRLRRVEIALLRDSRSAPRTCLWLRDARARFRRVRSQSGRTCDRPIWLRARGTRRWSFRMKRRLPAGRYVVLRRATSAQGAVESIFTRRRGNRRDFVLRRR